MTHLFTAAQSRAADARAIAELGCSGFELMLRAGRFAFDRLLSRWPDAGAVTVFCGKGNNAGDGYVIAGLARALGLAVTVVQVGPSPASGDALLAVRFAASQGVTAVDFAGGGWQPDAAVLVDALLGTGQRGVLRAPFAAAVRYINASGRPVLAVDVPTGLDADTGGATGDDAEVVRASLTTTFITRKLGQYTGLGREVCGEVCHDSLGVPATLCGTGVELLEQPAPRAPLPVNSYKHQRGHVAICGGDLSMGGAVILAGEAALRSGAGMVTIVTRPEHRPALLARRPELMVVDATDGRAVEALLDRVDVVVLGPGLGPAEWGAMLYQRVARHARAPVVLDADGFIHWLVAPGLLRPAVVTPHIAEAARLLGTGVAAVQSDRPAAVRALVNRTGAVAVLKGAGSLIAGHRDGDLVLSLCNAGNPAMATAGMGDVLCGVIAAEVATNPDCYAAVRQGVVRHAVAGDRAAARRGARALLATDVIAELEVLP